MIKWAVSRPAVVWATSIVILLGGIVSFTKLALATRTTVELPRLMISSSWTGASAELMEMYVERIRAVLADPERILDAMDSPRPIPA